MKTHDRRSIRSFFNLARVDHVKMIVFIMDENRPGTLSLTNDAESVVAALHQQFPGYRVIYRDSQGEWDEMVHNAGVFQGFRPAPNRNIQWGGFYGS